MKLKTLETSLIETLEDNKEEILDDKHPEDRLSEYVDGEIPVYNSEILELAMDNLWFAVEEPEILGFDGKNTAINAIVGNVYQHLLEVANEWLKEKTL